MDPIDLMLIHRPPHRRGCRHVAGAATSPDEGLTLDIDVSNYEHYSALGSSLHYT